MKNPQPFLLVPIDVSTYIYLVVSPKLKSKDVENLRNLRQNRKTLVVDACYLGNVEARVFTVIVNDDINL